MAVFQGDNTANNLQGGAENDVLIGFQGADTLNGGAGADTMIGGAGADTYFVDNVGDVVDETDGSGADAGGNDLVNTTISYNLTQFVERLTATGTADVILNGNALANTITGNGGNNVIYGGDDSAGAAADTLAGAGGNDTYIIREGVDDQITEAGDDTLAGTTGGVDTVQVVASSTRGAYALNAGAAVEIIIASDATSTTTLNLSGNEFAQTIVGNAGSNTLTGNATNVANVGADTLIGLGGDDIYNVTARNTIVIEQAGGGNDAVNITLGADSGTYAFGDNVETISAENVAATTTINITGGATNNSITGSAGANVLVGGGGRDTLAGLGGNDTYVVDSLDDVITEGAGDAEDRVAALSSYYIGQTAQVEVLSLGNVDLTTAVGGNGTLNLNAIATASTSNYLVGNGFSQTLYGDAGGNILDGFRGVNGDGTTNLNDTLVGGGGNDTYRVYAQNDVVVEDTDGGTFDFIYSSASFSLTENDVNARAATLTGTGRTGAAYIGATGVQQIEVLSTAQQDATTAGINLTGNTFGQIIIGNYGANVISDGGTVTTATGQTPVAAGNTGVFGTTGFTTGTLVTGGASTGSQDQLAGLRGDDTYFVTSVNTTVNENVGEGTDTVFVSLANNAFFGLITAAEVEFLNAVGTNNFNLAGNAFNQVIAGNDGNNTLDGRGGQDTLVGGAGNDTYFITTAQGAGNTTIIEATDGSTGGTADAVSTSVSFDLAATNASYVASNGAASATIGGNIGIEQIYVTNGQSTDNINLTGNGVAQLIVGNYGNNVLNGDNDTRAGGSATGALIGSGTVTANPVSAGGSNVADAVTAAGDTLTGLLGNDTYRVYNQADVVRENAGEGTDTVFTSGNYQLRAGTSIEVLAAADQSSTTGLRLIGNEFNQTVSGTAGNDQVWGGAGNDTLIGGAGSDTFGFATANAADADLLQDFAPGDFIGLFAGATTGTNTSTFGALRAQGTSTTGLDQNEFVIGTAATENHAQVIYNQATGQLFYDADGTGTANSAVLFATLAPNTGLGFNDFTLLTTAPTTAVAA